MSFRVRYLKEPASALTHLAGFLAAVAGLIWLIWKTPGPSAKTLSFVLYGSSLSILFLASTCYHFFDLGSRGNHILRRIDHAAIYLLICGTYIPPVMHYLDDPWRSGMLIALGIVATIGVLYKLLIFHAPTWLDVGVYLALGWMIFVPGARMFEPMSSFAFTCLVVGGGFYTVGAFVFALEWPDPWPKKFGHHEVWHLFVLAGAGSHFVFVYSMLELPLP